MGRPLVSILICSYNRAHLIQPTLDSVLNQTYQPVEIIFLDDGSTDNTEEVVRRYADKVQYYRQENSGIARARNSACVIAKGVFIAFQDDDDIMPSDRVETLYQAIAPYPEAVFAVGDLMTIDDTGALTGYRWLTEGMLSRDEAVTFDENAYEAVLWPKLPVAPHTTLFRRAAGEKVGWFNVNYKYASEDKDFFARLALLGKVIYVPRVVSYYRRGHGSLTANSTRTEYGALMMYQDHLRADYVKSPCMARRLRFRMYLSLRRIFFECSMGARLPEGLEVKDLRSFAQALSFKDMARLYSSKWIFFPLKRLIKTILAR